MCVGVRNTEKKKKSSLFYEQSYSLESFKQQM